MSNLGTPPAEWLAETFEFEYCAECGGDACHHMAIPFLGNWFALCRYPPVAAGDDVQMHPVIQSYRGQEVEL